MKVPREYQSLKEGSRKGVPREERCGKGTVPRTSPSVGSRALGGWVFWRVRKETGCDLLGEGEGESGGIRSGCGQGIDVVRTEVR